MTLKPKKKWIIYLSTRRFKSANCRWFTNVLMVTTTEWMVYWVHANTSYSWPAVSFSFVFMVCSACFQDRFINTTTTSNNTLTQKILKLNFIYFYTCIYSIWVLSTRMQFDNKKNFFYFQNLHSNHLIIFS